MKKYLKPFLIIVLIYPFVSWIFDLALGSEQQIWHSTEDDLIMNF